MQETDLAPLSGATLELRRHKERGGWGWPKISGEGDKNMAGGGKNGQDKESLLFTSFPKKYPSTTGRRPTLPIDYM